MQRTFPQVLGRAVLVFVASFAFLLTGVSAVTIAARWFSIGHVSLDVFRHIVMPNVLRAAIVAGFITVAYATITLLQIRLIEDQKDDSA